MDIFLPLLMIGNMGLSWKILDRLHQYHYRLKSLEDKVFYKPPCIESPWDDQNPKTEPA